MKYLVILLIIAGCLGYLKHENLKVKVKTSVMLDQIDLALKENYCPKAVAKYIAAGGKFHDCDSALFAGLLGTACPGVDIAPFENEENPGQMCRTWDCDCYLPDTGVDNGSDSQYSKDMNAGLQLNFAVRRVNRDLMQRIVDYLIDNNLIMCDAIDEITFATKCLMPPNTFKEWKDMLASFQGTASKLQKKFELTQISGFERHLAVIGAIKQGEIYGGITNVSKDILKANYQAEPNNVVYNAAWRLYSTGDMRDPAEKWLAQCPTDRLPDNHHDWCTDYKFQRDEEGTDWDVCPERAYEEHPGVDCAFAGWIILHNREETE